MVRRLYVSFAMPDLSLLCGESFDYCVNGFVEVVSVLWVFNVTELDARECERCDVTKWDVFF